MTIIAIIAPEHDGGRHRPPAERGGARVPTVLRGRSAETASGPTPRA